MAHNSFSDLGVDLFKLIWPLQIFLLIVIRSNNVLTFKQVLCLRSIFGVRYEGLKSVNFQSLFSFFDHEFYFVFRGLFAYFTDCYSRDGLHACVQSRGYYSHLTIKHLIITIITVTLKADVSASS